MSNVYGATGFIYDPEGGSKEGLIVRNCHRQRLILSQGYFLSQK